MKKIKFDTYNDGMLKVYENKELFDSKNNAIGKELIEKNKFFFAYSSIRESDKYRLETNTDINIKVKVRRNNIITTNDLIKIDESFYAIEKVDKNSNNLFLYLKNYIDDMNKIIEIYTIVSRSSLIDPKDILLKKVFANIKSSNVENAENDSIGTSKKIKFKIKFIEELIDNNSTVKYKIKFEDSFYDIKIINDIDERHEVLEIQGVEM